MSVYIFNFTISGEVVVSADSLEEADTIINRMTDEEIIEASSGCIADVDFYKEYREDDNLL